MRRQKSVTASWSVSGSSSCISLCGAHGRKSDAEKMILKNSIDRLKRFYVFFMWRSRPTHRPNVLAVVMRWTKQQRSLFTTSNQSRFKTRPVTLLVICDLRTFSDCQIILNLRQNSIQSIAHECRDKKHCWWRWSMLFNGAISLHDKKCAAFVLAWSTFRASVGVWQLQ